MTFSPCCCISLKSSAITTGTLGVIFAIVKFAILILELTEINKNDKIGTTFTVILGQDIICGLIINILLIMGSKWGKVNMMLPWFFFGFFEFIMFFIWMFYLNYKGILMCLLLILLNFYFGAIFILRIKEVKREEQLAGFETNPIHLDYTRIPRN